MKYQTVMSNSGTAPHSHSGKERGGEDSKFGLCVFLLGVDPGIVAEKGKLIN